MRALLLVIFVLTTTSLADGAGRVLAFVHGNDLLEHCQDRNATCVSYVTGLADAFEMVAPYLTHICRPAAVTTDQLVDVIIAWLEQHPADRHRPAATLAGLAFAEAWPCDK